MTKPTRFAERPNGCAFRKVLLSLKGVSDLRNRPRSPGRLRGPPLRSLQWSAAEHEVRGNSLLNLFRSTARVSVSQS